MVVLIEIDGNSSRSAVHYVYPPSQFGGVLGLRIGLRLRLPDDDFTLSLLLLLALQGVRSDRTVGAEFP